MKKIVTAFSILLAVGCATKNTVIDQTKIALQSDCPANGNCTIEVFDNKKIVVKRDEFGNTYYTIEDDLNKKVFKYSYSKIVKGNIQDAGYREEIVFEIENLNNQEFSDDNIQQTKMLFGRFCYCKGQTGNYKVTSGKFSIKNKKADLNFTITEVPQIISSIQFDFK